METLPVQPADGSSRVNTGSVKSDEGSPRPEGGRGSPPPNCAICLGTCQNKSFTDSCLHQFCFNCLLTWSKVKAECPLCKQNFRSIIHNVRSNHQYEEYMVEQRTDETIERIDLDNITNTTRRFRYRTTLTFPRRESMAIQQLLLHYPLIADVFPPPALPVPSAPARRRRSPTSFRRTVYEHNLWARPLPDFTGRYRDCSPEFYQFNDAQMHRLVPWLNRELSFLLNDNIHHISYVMAAILELLPQYHINSTEFRDIMRQYFSDRTEHFLHELYCFACTPYDMTGYDRNVQYTTDFRMSTMVNEVLSSSESEASADSDIVMVTSSQPSEPAAGPSRVPDRVPEPVYPSNNIPITGLNNVIPIETISNSDSDDSSSEVIMVKYIKPPQDRTPEIVDLLGSDSDVIVQENSPPAPEPQEPINPPLLVKLSLKRHIPTVSDNSDSDSSWGPTLNLKRPKQHSNDSDTTVCTSRATPSPVLTDDSWIPTKTATLVSPIDRKKSWSTSDNVSTDSDSDSEYVVRKRSHKKKSRKKSKSKTSRHKKTVKSKSPLRNTERNKDDKRKKLKSRSGKGIKSSKRRDPVQDQSSTSAEPESLSTDQPSCSGVASKRKKTKKEKRRDSRNKLRSVVKSVNSKVNSDSKSSEYQFNDSKNSDGLGYHCDRDSMPEGARTPKLSDSHPGLLLEQINSYDSDDDLPLNLTVNKRNDYSI